MKSWSHCCGGWEHGGQEDVRDIRVGGQGAVEDSRLGFSSLHYGPMLELRKEKFKERMGEWLRMGA